MTLWGISTVGSARHSHCRGQGFDSPMLHKKRPPFTGGSFFVPHRVVKPRDRRQCGALERESRLRPPVEEISQAAFSTDKEWISTMWSHDYIGCGTGVRHSACSIVAIPRCGTCSFSHGLIGDETPATGSCRRFASMFHADPCRSTAARFLCMFFS